MIFIAFCLRLDFSNWHILLLRKNPATYKNPPVETTLKASIALDNYWCLRYGHLSWQIQCLSWTRCSFDLKFAVTKWEQSIILPATVQCMEKWQSVSFVISISPSSVVSPVSSSSQLEWLWMHEVLK